MKKMICILIVMVFTASMAFALEERSGQKSMKRPSSKEPFLSPKAKEAASRAKNEASEKGPFLGAKGQKDVENAKREAAKTFTGKK
jgi:hypothetical protein